MNGGQDLGGMMGLGPIAPEPNEPVFHAEWEKRALAVTVAAGACGLWTIDGGRFARESLPPAQYLTKSYYDSWITALAKLLVQHGLASEAELQAGRPLEPARAVKRVIRADEVAATLAKGFPYDRPASAPARFAIGDAVMTKVMNPPTHTRLPRYARGKRGIVEAIRGCHVFPDTAAHDLGENPQWLYAVRFTGAELWGDEADPTLSVGIEAFEPYLMAAP